MTGSAVIIYSNFGPYHIARLNALAKILPTTYAIEIASDEQKYPWQPDKERLEFRSKTLFTSSSFESVAIRWQCKAVKEALSEISPEIVALAGYGEPVMRSAADWARNFGVSTVLLFISTWFDHRRKWWRELGKTYVIKRFSSVAVAGKRAADYALKLGVSQNRIFITGNVVDNSHFQEASHDILKNANSQKTELNLPERYFLAVSRLSPEKNYPMLLRAFGDYRQQGGTWDLVIVGNGIEQEKLCHMTKELNLSGVHFIGWKSYEELPAYYALASCFILPSLSEPWGLVVNEAMACGLPVLLSRACGCSPELCRTGENGFDFDPRNTSQMVRLMLRMSCGKEDLEQMGQASRRIISEFTPERWAGKLKHCIKHALKTT